MTTLSEIAVALVVIAIPVSWLVAEFRGKRVRITFGLLTILCSFGIAAIIGKTTELNYNAWFSRATSDLIFTIVEQVEDSELDRVMTVLRSLNRQYQPTYENRANYQALVEDATARMRGDVEITEGSVWDASPFDHTTWLGYWENDTGDWVVIERAGDSFEIVQSDSPGGTRGEVALSDDNRILTFYDKSQWRYTLKLINKYEAEYERFNVETQFLRQTKNLHKLIRPTQEQKRMTQQGESAVPSEAAPSVSSDAR